MKSRSRNAFARHCAQQKAYARAFASEAAMETLIAFSPGKAGLINPIRSE